MNAFAGTPVLLRLALRRDRVALPAWLGLLTASTASTALSFRSLYGTAEARQAFAAGIGADSSLRALYGPLYDASTVGGLTVWRTGVFAAVVAALMSTLLVVRHTRAEEEDGRLELVGAGAVGRRAPLTAALLAAATADLLLALLVAAALTAAGQSPAGSLALGLATGGCGLVFAGVAAVTAQVAATARAANGLAGALLAAAFVLRAAGDAGPGPLRVLGRLSPLGWAEQVRPFAADRWWMLLPPAAAFALAAVAAHTLAARRDLGAGLLPQRPGPAAAAPALRSAAALAARLQRAPLAGWTAGAAVAGLVFGGVSGGVADLAGGNAQVADLMARLGGRSGLADSYLATTTGLFGMAAAGYAVQAVLRLRTEETSGRAEPLLATAVPRLRWAAGHLLFPLLGAAALLAAAGLATGLGRGAAGGGTGRAVVRLLPAALAQLPAVWCTAAAALAVYGLLPRWTAAGRGVLAGAAAAGWLGPVLRLPQWVLDVSPFTHAPHLPGGPVPVAPTLLLTAAAAVLTAAGLAGLHRRDLG